MTTLKYRLHTAETAMLLAVCITLCLTLWGQASQAALANDLIRLHVIAHSDDEYEQALKLRVRDAVLSYAQPLLDGTKNADEAEQILLDNMDNIKKAALSAAEGRDVKVALTRESYPTRNYGSFALPAGKYRSLRILLGSAEGRNWWCVIFPPLCASASAEAAVETLGEDGTRMITADGSGYILRFRCAELFGELSRTLDRH